MDHKVFDENFPSLSPVRFGKKEELKFNEKNVMDKDKGASFAAVVKGKEMKLVLGPPIAIREPTFEDGLPVISFTNQEIEELQKPFETCIIAKFSRVRAELGLFKNWVKQERSLKNEVNVSALDSRHILLHFESEEEFLQVYSLGDLKWNGEWVTLLRWSPFFRPNLRSTEFPITMGVPGINIHLQNLGVLQSIARALGGRFLTVEEKGTLSYAKFRMELDLLKDRKDWVIIQNGEQKFKQRIVYENLPPFCRHCCLKGHVQDTCRDLNKPKALAQPKVTKRWVEKETKEDNMGKEKEEDSAKEIPNEKTLKKNEEQKGALAGNEEKIVNKAKEKGKDVMEVMGVSEDEDEERIRYKNKEGELVVSSWPKEILLENCVNENVDSGAEPSKRAEASVAAPLEVEIGQHMETQFQVLGESNLVDNFLNSVITNAAESLIKDLAEEVIKNDLGVDANVANTPKSGEENRRTVEKIAEKQAGGYKNSKAESSATESMRNSKINNGKIATAAIEASGGIQKTPEAKITAKKAASGGSKSKPSAVTSAVPDHSEDKHSSSAEKLKEKEKIKPERGLCLLEWSQPMNKSWYTTEASWKEGLEAAKNFKNTKEDWGDGKKSGLFLMRGTKRELFTHCKGDMHYEEYRRKVEKKLEVKLKENAEWQDGCSMLKEGEKKKKEFNYIVDDTSFSDLEVCEMRKRNMRFKREMFLKDAPLRKQEEMWIGEDWRLRWKDIYENDLYTGVFCNSWDENELNDFHRRLRRGDINKAILVKKELDLKAYLKDSKRKIRRKPHERYQNYFKFTDASGFSPRNTSTPQLGGWTKIT